VNIQPADHVLSGFLTPAEPPATSDETDDLPRDSDYEQSSLGLEWLCPIAIGQVDLQVGVELAMFVRVLPSKDEQIRHGRWDRVDRHDRMSAREATLVPVWERLTLPPLRVPIHIASLEPGRKATIDLGPAFGDALRLAAADRSGLYPGRTEYAVPESAFDAFEGWLENLPRKVVDAPWTAQIDVRATRESSTPSTARLSLRLINRTQVPRQSRSFVDPNLYTVKIRVESPSAAHKYGTFRELEDSYRYDLRLPAVGLNCHAQASIDEATCTMWTEVVPRSELPRLLPRDIPQAVPTFESMTQDPVDVLRRLCEAMRRYDADVWASTLNGLTGAQRDEATADRARFLRDEIDAFERGIRLLADPSYPLVLSAFRFMNETMATVASTSRHPYETWRLFQIVFIVKTLPILASREYPELSVEGDDAVDILWFAAGGGKTEAFLSLIVWQAFFDRLRGKHVGTTAFVRFPLRLLAFQQLRRTCRAMAIAELIRRREGLSGARFSVGYFVGGTQTPNRIDDDRHRRYVASGVPAKEAKLLRCPFCSADVNLAYDASLRLLEHRCSDSACPGGRERLPLYVVDYDVYQYLPTVVVSTVDKLAQFGQQQRFANLFGRVTAICGRHGATYQDVNRTACPAADKLGRSNEPRLDSCDGTRVSYGPFKDLGPALLVQDELHLMSEELGTFDAHYETAVMHLSTSLGCRPWKIIAATATISRFEDHAHHLYLKAARLFPAPGPSAYESFYYQLDRNHIGRIFIGVLGIGRKHTPAVTKTLSLVYQELELARRLSNDDLPRALERYSMDAGTSADALRMLLYYYELVLTYVLTRKGSDQVAEAIESRVKRELSEAAGGGVDQLRIETFNGSVDMAEMIASMEAIEDADPSSPPEERIRGLVTTNIIGHGVDVDRFNWIVFAGFTRLVAEYIQASARVGRTLPGLVVFVTTPQSERDRTVYQRFQKFHEYLDRLVDPSAVNRWPSAAIRRTMPGLLSGYLMGVAAPAAGRRLETVEKVQRAVGAKGAEALLAENVVAWLLAAIGAEDAPSPSQYRRVADGVVRNLYARIIDGPPTHEARERLLNAYLDAMRSLRDVDEPAFISTDGQADGAILRRLIRA
jgi:Helicase conserved C-terminal domain